MISDYRELGQKGLAKYEKTGNRSRSSSTAMENSSSVDLVCCSLRFLLTTNVGITFVD